MGGAPVKTFSIPTTTLKVGSSCWGGPVLCFLVAYINLWRGGGSHAKTRNNINKWKGGKLINLKNDTILQLFWHSLLNGVSWYSYVGVCNVDSFAQSTIRLLLGQSLPSVPAIYLTIDTYLHRYVFLQCRSRYINLLIPKYQKGDSLEWDRNLLHPERNITPSTQYQICSKLTPNGMWTQQYCYSAMLCVCNVLTE